MSPDRLLLGSALLAVLSALVSLAFLLRARARARRWEAVLQAVASSESLSDAAVRALAVLGATLGVEALYIFQRPDLKLLARWDSLGERESQARAREGEPLGPDLVLTWLGETTRARRQAFVHQVQPLIPLLRALSVGEREDPQQGFLALARVAGGVAHELNSPLAAILTEASRLKKTSPDPRRAETIVQAVERCRTVVDKLLLYARRPYDMVQQNASFSQLVRLPVDLNAMASETAQRLEVDGLAVTTELGSLQRRFAGDSRQLSDRLVDLLCGQESLYLATREEPDRLVLEVRASGELLPAPLEGLEQTARDHGGALETENGRLLLRLPALS
ncbi:sensor histidine kinase [bacterium CPR1]|nr:sensor histidine kinase [bacterium CPR1]